MAFEEEAALSTPLDVVFVGDAVDDADDLLPAVGIVGGLDKS